MLNKNRVEEFINAAMKYKGDRYSQPKRMQPGYSDCSSLIYKALSDCGYLKDPGVTVTTYRMGVSGDGRFKKIPMTELQRGDILWGGNYVNGKWSGHVAIYLGDGKTIEARYKEGVDYNVKRPYFTRAYRIVALEENTKPVPVSYALLNVMGKEAKISPYIRNGVSYVLVGKTEVPIRDLFEMLGYVVKWQENPKTIIIE